MALCSCSGVLWVIAVYLVYKILDKLIRYPHVWGRLQRYVFITGCDTGFGHELAKRLERNGYGVFAGVLTEKGEEILRIQCSERLKTVRLDVTKLESIQKAFEFVKKNLPEGRGLWGLMNNAGISGKIGPAEWLEISDYEECFNVNLYGVINTTVTFLPLIKKEKGRVVSTASVFGRTALTGGAPYTISKYGVEAFSDGLRRQLRDYGCSVSIIEPGLHKTNITSASTLTRWYEASWNRLSPEIKQEYGQEFFDKSKDMIINRVMNRLASSRISDVVDAYEHALVGMFPRARYLVGLDAKLLWLPLQWMPEWLGDFIQTKANRHRPIPAVLKNK